MKRNFGSALGEPLHLLQPHPLPGRVADYGVEAAIGPVVRQMPPDAGEGDLPVEERLLRRQGPRP
ncbi:MAG: hypothetical protein OXH14_13755, partial [Alphaproteobacteria bacterium]|nr:hypothetical protein [Alphaproteobacteria bacterium]